MEKQIATTYGGSNARVGEMLVNRMMPNRYIEAVGPFVFLDHIYPYIIPEKEYTLPTGEFAHPHRGIATFSYVFSGQLEHFDSKGNHGIVGAGGAQWMKAGKGIIHDENPLGLPQENGLFHSLQFWINLPPEIKEEEPEYLNIPDEAFVKVALPQDAGTMKVLIGMCGDHASPVKTFSKQFLYHYRLNPKSTYVLETRPGLEYAAFVPAQELKINHAPVNNSEIMVFSTDEGEIVLHNNNITAADVLVFGGEPYQEPIIAEGPFVMNSSAGIATAYRDFFNGAYGTINYKH